MDSEEFDIAVIGAGPAGLSAAARAAWVDATHGRGVLGLRVLLVEACPSLGGFARWQPLMTYGPKSFFSGRDIQQLRSTCAEHGVRIERADVTKIERLGPDRFQMTAPGCRHTAVSIVIATGLRHGFELEPWLFQQGRLMLLPSRQMRPRVQALSAAGARTFLVFGARPPRSTMELVRQAAPEAQVIGVDESQSSGADETDVHSGRIVGLDMDGDCVCLTVQPRVVRESRVLRADVLMMDCESYAAAGASLGPAGDLGLLTDGSYVATDKLLATSVPGAFAAGDVTGPPLGIAKALGEGMVAGLSAYRHVYLKRRGELPDLFPYFPNPA